MEGLIEPTQENIKCMVDRYVMMNGQHDDILSKSVYLELWESNIKSPTQMTIGRWLKELSKAINCRGVKKFDLADGDYVIIDWKRFMEDRKRRGCVFPRGTKLNKSVPLKVKIGQFGGVGVEIDGAFYVCDDHFITEKTEAS